MNIRYEYLYYNFNYRNLTINCLYFLYIHYDYTVYYTVSYTSISITIRFSITISILVVVQVLSTIVRRAWLVVSL